MYPKEKAEQDKIVSPYIYYVLRPLSHRFSKVLHQVGFSANTITTVSAILLILGLYFVIGFGHFNPWYEMLVGGVLINIYLYLDVVDGNVARLSDKSSRFGEFYDSTLNIFAGFTVPIFATIGLYRNIEIDIFWQFFGLDYLLLICGISIGILRLFRRVIMDNIDRIKGGERYKIFGKNVGTLKYLAAIINSTVFPLLLVSILLNVISIWVMVYFILNLIAIIVVLMSGYKTLTKI